MTVNLVAFFTITQLDNLIVSGDWSIAKICFWLLEGSFAVILSGIINGQVTPNMKARLVFWRWKNPLPGSRAFSFYALNDDRVNFQSLQQVSGTLPTDPKEQNALWYRLYTSVSNDESVSSVHQDFLLYRDYSVLSLLFLFVFGIAGFFFFTSLEGTLTYIAILIIQAFLTNNAARDRGKRFVTTVMALKAAGK
jgi:hypothetical protein